MKKTILFLAANPSVSARLHLGMEIREIDDALRRAKYRDHFILEKREAVRPRDVRRALLECQPNIVHFSGHGAGKRGLILEDENGGEQLVTGEALAGLFGMFSKQIECVLLNACYSTFQADTIVQHVDYVVGMDDSISDRAAIEFAIGFYDALAAHTPELYRGSPIEFAFKLACNAIQLEGILEHQTPNLVKKGGIIMEARESIRIHNAAHASKSKAIPFEQVLQEELESKRAYKSAKRKLEADKTKAIVLQEE